MFPPCRSLSCFGNITILQRMVSLFLAATEQLNKSVYPLVSQLKIWNENIVCLEIKRLLVQTCTWEPFPSFTHVPLYPTPPFFFPSGLPPLFSLPPPRLWGKGNKMLLLLLIIICYLVYYYLYDYAASDHYFWIVIWQWVHRRLMHTNTLALSDRLSLSAFGALVCRVFVASRLFW